MALSRSTRIWIFLAILFIIGLLWLAYFYFTLAPVSAQFELAGTVTAAPPEGSVPVVVERGSGLQEIAQSLVDQQVVRSASAFKVYAILSGSAHQLKPGLYLMSRASSTPELIRLLVAGPAKEISVLIPEGTNLADIDKTLARYGVIHAGGLLKLRIADFYDRYPFLRGARSLEGFLFPDTYRFYFDSDPMVVAKVMLDNYASRVGPLIADGATIDWDNIPITRRGIFTSLQITTIASLIEKEVPDSAERRIVADILYRRLKLDMPLQIDATVDYAKNNGDRYDTYQFYGLPPGPIASPGVDALEAALNPKTSPYLYYLSDPKTKKTIFSRDFEEHKANKEKYLR
jgi:UPF0755 protein